MNKDYSEYAKMTQDEVYDAVFKGYKRKYNRLREIFDQDSERNKRLSFLAEVYEALIPDLRKEFEKLGCRYVATIKYPDYFTPNSEEVFELPDGRYLVLFEYYSIWLSLEGEKNEVHFTKNDKPIGDAEREAVSWLKERLEDE